MTARWRNDISLSAILLGVMQATDVTRHSRIAQQLVPSTIALSFVCHSQFASKKKVAHDFRYDPRSNRLEVIDLTLGTDNIGDSVFSWHISNETSLPDHRYIRFQVCDPVTSGVTYCNPK